MNIAGFSVRRPVAMACLFIALMALGVNAYRKMALELLPKVDVPYITIVTIYPGASPSEIETDIAKRIEDAVGTLDGLKHVTNSCMEDSCLTFLEFNLDVNVDVAATDVREKLDLIQNDLPAEAERPKILKFDINAQPIIEMALTGDVSLEELYDYADNVLSDRLSVVPGVAEVQLIGGAEREVHVLLDRTKLAAHGLSSLDVVQALQQGVKTVPSGRVKEKGSEYNVKFDAEYKDVGEIGTLEIANRDGTRCYVSDVAEVKMTTDEQRQSAFIDGRPAVAVRVVKKADANAVQVVDRVRAVTEELRKTLPGGMELMWVDDDGAYIRATVNSTTGDIFQGILLTAGILLLFLINLRTTFIVAVTMPLTILTSLYFLYSMDYSLNISTLLAVGLSVGILVTNSIVVLENIVRRLTLTEENTKEAASRGASEVLIAVIASAGTNLVVLFPIANMASRVGLFFRPFALTMVVVTAVSLLISFTLTPILASLLLRKRAEGERKGIQKRLEQVSDHMFNVLSGGYTRFIRFVGRHRWTAIPILGVSILLFLHSLTLASKVGFGFFPDGDQGSVLVKLEFPTHYNLQQTETRLREALSRLDNLPGMEHSLAVVGKVEGVMGQASEGVYLAQVSLEFCDKMERSETIDDLVAVVRQRLAGYTDCIVTVSLPSGVGGQNYPIEMEIAGDDLDLLDGLALKISAVSQGIEGIVDPDTSVRAGKPELRIRPKRPVLADLSIPAVGLGTGLRANLAGIEAATYKRGDRTYDIRVKYAEEQGSDQVKAFQFPGAPGKPLTLSSLAEIEQTRSPVQITRTDKRRVSKVLAQLIERTPLGTAVDGLSKAVDDQAMLPAGYSYRFAGMYEVMQEGGSEFMEAGLLATLLTYLLLAAILESFTKPIIIMVTLPMGLIGMMWALYLGGQSIDMFVLLGTVMMIGIVVNNAILIMDRVNQYQAQGFSAHESMARAAGEEIRPILMITMAAVLGMVPLATGSGLGSEMRAGIGLASIGGIGISAFLTLIIIPVLYEMMTRERKGPAKGQSPVTDVAAGERHA